MQRFTTQLRVRYHEMDPLGHVNNAVYLHYLEQAAIEHSEYLGFGEARYRELGGIFVLRRMQVEYLRPAVAGDTLAVETWLQEMRGPRVIRRYEIRRRNGADLLVIAEAVWVWVDAASVRPKAIPASILEVFQAASQTTNEVITNSVS
ncbi:thioesterase family protein [Leptolyngbya sp. FACHB-261]|uniref:acyl-CoA thioesterase n=1 Tax=Leptolyngbya sp. FACHB-261 TaxID=2692806 RepID=UPI001684F936|nr:thioesterase family protein [Leptolyngbya sp. FACHB-261]MBD2101795.1 acyl-CoA thioesterase [Leptolyngbya sp. FACHB-261]